MKNFLYLPCSSEKINVINMKKLFFAGLLTAIVGGECSGGLTSLFCFRRSTGGNTAAPYYLQSVWYTDE